MIDRVHYFATIPSPLNFMKKTKQNLPFLYLVFLVLLTYKQENLENTR